MNWNQMYHNYEQRLFWEGVTVSSQGRAMDETQIAWVQLW